MNFEFCSSFLQNFVGKNVSLTLGAGNVVSGTLNGVTLNAGVLELTVYESYYGRYTACSTKTYPNLLQRVNISCGGMNLMSVVLQGVGQSQVDKMKMGKYDSLVQSLDRAGILDPVILLTDGGERLEVEKFLLTARSPVFARMFLTDMKEKQSGEVLVAGYSRDALALFLDVVHARDMDLDRLKENIEHVVKLLDLYEVGCLVELTGLEAKEFINVENVADRLFLAGNHRQPGLLEYAWKLLRENKQTVLKSDRWQELIRAGFGGLDGRSVMALVNAT